MIDHILHILSIFWLHIIAGCFVVSIGSVWVMEFMIRMVGVDDYGER